MRRAAAVAVIALGALAVLPASGGAAFHLIKISEVFPGTPAAFDKAFIELRMVSSGQNQVGGHSITIYDSAGVVVNTTPMTSMVPNGENNRTVLLGDIDVTNADFPANIGTLVNPTGGAVCFADAVPADCVAWGNFSNPAALPAPVGANVAPGGIPASGTTASSLTRDISAGCPTFLEPLDDTDDSLADFDLTDAESPEANADPLTTVECDSSAPQTTITKHPKAKTTKEKATFRFESDEPGSGFECKLDRQSYTPCSSPARYKKLGPRKHKFRVFAVDAAGNVDATPAKATWKVLD